MTEFSFYNGVPLYAKTTLELLLTFSMKLSVQREKILHELSTAKFFLTILFGSLRKWSQVTHFCHVNILKDKV